MPYGAKINCRSLGSHGTIRHAMVLVEVHSLLLHAKHTSACWLKRNHLQNTVTVTKKCEIWVKHKCFLLANFTAWCKATKSAFICVAIGVH